MRREARLGLGARRGGARWLVQGDQQLAQKADHQLLARSLVRHRAALQGLPRASESDVRLVR